MDWNDWDYDDPITDMRCDEELECFEEEEEQSIWDYAYEHRPEIG